MRRELFITSSYAGLNESRYSKSPIYSLEPDSGRYCRRFKGINLDHLIGIVAARLELDVDLILSSSRQRTVALARSIICCLAVDQLMLSGTLVASQLNLTPSAVSKLVSRGRLETETREIAKELPEVK